MSRSDPSPAPAGPGTTASLPRARVALLFTVMLVTAAGNTAMQSVMPSIGTALKVEDVWISLAYTWSALLWMTCAPMWARRSDRRGRKAMMAIGLLGFISSFGLCGLALWLGLNGWLGPSARCCCSRCADRCTADSDRLPRRRSRPMSPAAPAGRSGLRRCR
ncbi:hypothetical protein [Novosphingobium sp.]|uniref:hypothetical protein n=1 Tax=Novosphingobium sp. TaxID=1874826 RepID=UPI003439D03F